MVHNPVVEPAYANQLINWEIGRFSLLNAGLTDCTRADCDLAQSVIAKYHPRTHALMHDLAGECYVLCKCILIGLSVLALCLVKSCGWADKLAPQRRFK